VVNLLRNAAMHARSTVTVSLRRENDRTVIHVDDDGSGIAIVRQVALWHGGDASISESPLGGARVSIAR
jgi:two-component system, OmpR family, sensor kinase ParS